MLSNLSYIYAGADIQTSFGKFKKTKLWGKLESCDEYLKKFLFFLLDF